MNTTETPFAEAARELLRVARFFSARGSVPATSGNFSVRLPVERPAGKPVRRIAITRSGIDKGELAESDILLADIDVPPPAAASAETPLHIALYRNLPECGAVVHTHANVAAILSLALASEGKLVLTGWELQKALRGVATHEARVVLPIFANDQDVPALAVRVSAGLATTPDAVAYLLAGHGLYTWGVNLAEAQRHAVALEHLLTCELERRKIRP